MKHSSSIKDMEKLGKLIEKFQRKHEVLFSSYRKEEDEGRPVNGNTGHPSSEAKTSKSISDTTEAKPSESISDTIIAGRCSYLDLSGNSKKIIDCIARRCLVLGDSSTGFIEKNKLSAETGVKPGAIRTTVNRLKARGVIVEVETTKGRSSSWKFTLSKHIFDAILTN